MTRSKRVAGYNGFSVKNAAHRPLLPLLLALGLAVGGCIPCQNLFVAQPVKKSCCKKNGECQKPGPTDPKQKSCSLQLAKLHFDLQEHSHSFEPALVVSIPIGPDDLPARSLREHRSEPLKSEHSPPQLFLLHSTFLI